MTTGLLQSRTEYDTMHSMNIKRMVKPLVNWSAVAMVAALTLLYVAVYQLPAYGDFTTDFYTVSGLVNPYEYGRFLNPPWVVLLLRPFALLPEHAAGALWVTLSVCLIVYSIHLLGTDRLGMALTLLNPFMWFFITLGQLDALVLFGFALAWHERHEVIRPFDMLLMGIKPQVIGIAALYRLHEYTRRDWLLLAGAGVLSLLIWGAWPLAMVGNWGAGVYHPLDMGIFPYGVPVGLLLVYLSWRRKSAVLAALSTYFFVPYVGPGSIIVYLAIIFSTYQNKPVRLALWLFVWVYAVRLII